MKIVNFNEFILLPEGTIFSLYCKPDHFEQLNIKGRVSVTVKDTKVDYLWYYQPLIGNIKCEDSVEYNEKLENAERGQSVELDFVDELKGNDLMLSSDELFVIWEEKDWHNFVINRVEQINRAYSNV